MMTKPDPRVAKNTASVIALRNLLRSIISEPNLYFDDEYLISSLKSQGKTASLKYSFTFEESIFEVNPVSLNTLKSYSGKLFDGGFEDVDNLRVRSLESINNYKRKASSPNKRTKEGLLATVKELESDLEKHRKINFILLQALSSSIFSIKGIKSASTNVMKEKRCEDAIEKLRAIVSLNPAPFNEVFNNTNVVDMKDFNDK